VIRDYLGPQIEKLWGKEEFRVGESELAPVSTKTMLGRQYVPLVGLGAPLEVDLSVLLLRRDNPASLFVSGGDLDNHLKTLFDALQTPASAQECGEDPALGGEERRPIFTVVENDRLITGLTVRSERWLTTENLNEVLVILDVTLRVTKVTWGNMPLLG
jgi:hypothetical protein